MQSNTSTKNEKEKGENIWKINKRTDHLTGINWK